MAMEASFSGSGGRHLLYATRTMEIPPETRLKAIMSHPAAPFPFPLRDRSMASEEALQHPRSYISFRAAESHPGRSNRGR